MLWRGTSAAGGDRRTRAGEWQRFLPLNLAGSTLGVIGLGRLGSQVAAVGRAFGMSVLAWSPHLTADRAALHAGSIAWRWTGRLRRRAGAARAEVRRRVRAERRRDRRHAPAQRGKHGPDRGGAAPAARANGYLINTSCGPIVDADALLAALHAGSIADAGLDVYDVEPVPPGHPLLTAPRTVLSPHVGFVSRRSYAVAYAGAVEDILAWLDGQPVRVQPPEECAMSSMLTAVGFVGLGAMGLPMARRLIAADHRVHVTDVVQSSVAAAVANGAIAEAHARAVADAAPVVLVSLPTPAVVSAVALGDNGLLGGAALRTYVDLSTTGRTTARQVAATLAAAGVQAVDAPVSGGVPGAVNGTLTIMVAGVPEAVAAARPFLDSLASKVVLVGPGDGAGSAGWPR